MKLKTIVLAALVMVLVSVPSFAQTTNITATKIQHDPTGALLSSGFLCALPVSALGQPSGYTAGSGGTVLPEQICTPVTNGAISGLALDDVSLVSPPGIGYQVTIEDGNHTALYVLPQPIFPTGSTWSLDAWSPTTSYPVPASGLSYSTIAPQGRCSAPSVVYTPSGTYQCINQIWVIQSTSSGGGGTPVAPSGDAFVYSLLPGTNLQSAVTSLAASHPGSTIQLAPGHYSVYPYNSTSNIMLSLPSAGGAVASGTPIIPVAVNIVGSGQNNTFIDLVAPSWNITSVVSNGTTTVWTLATTPTALATWFAAGNNLIEVSGLTLLTGVNQTKQTVIAVSGNTVTTSTATTVTSGTETGTLTEDFAGGVSDAAEFNVANVSASGTPAIGSTFSWTLLAAPTTTQMIPGSVFETYGLTTNANYNFAFFTVTGVSGNTVTATLLSTNHNIAPPAVTNGADTGTIYVKDTPFGYVLRDFTINANWSANKALYMPYCQSCDIEHISSPRTGYSGIDFAFSNFLGGGAHFFESTLNDLNGPHATADYTATSRPGYCWDFDTSATDNHMWGGTCRSASISGRINGGSNFFYSQHGWGSYAPNGLFIVTGATNDFIGCEPDGISYNSGNGAPFLLNAGSDGTTIMGCNLITNSGSSGAPFAIIQGGVNHLQFIGNNLTELNGATQAFQFNPTRANDNKIIGNSNDFGQESLGTPYVIPSSAAVTWNLQNGNNQLLTLSANNTVVTISNVTYTGLPGSLLTICQPTTGTPFTGASYVGYIYGGAFPPAVLGSCIVQHFTSFDGLHIQALSSTGLATYNTRIDGLNRQNWLFSDDAGGSLGIFNSGAPYTRQVYIGNSAASQTTITDNGDLTANNLAAFGGFNLIPASTPGAPTITNTNGGSTTYNYSCQAVDVNGQNSAIGTAASTTTGAALLSGTAYNTVICPGTNGAKTFNICNGSGLILANVSAVTANTTGFNDTGAATIGTCPVTATTGSVLTQHFALKDSALRYTLSLQVPALLSSGNLTQTLPNCGGCTLAAALVPATVTPTGGSGTGTITCLTATCTNLRGTYSVSGGSFTTGTFLTLAWTATSTPYVCTASQQFVSTTNYGVSHSVPTVNGFFFTSAASIAGATVIVDYSCQP